MAKTYPQDEGTGLSSLNDADFFDSANLAALVYNPNAEDFVLFGLTVSSIDYTNRTVTLTTGAVRITATSLAEKNRSEFTPHTWDNGIQVHDIDSQQLSWASGDEPTLHIYANADQTSPDSSTLTLVDSEANAPSEPALKVMEIDTSAETETLVNRNPAARFEEVRTAYWREDERVENVSGSTDVDASVAPVHELTLTGDTTLSLAGGQSGVTNSVTVVLIQDGTGSHSLTLPSSAQWADGTEPSLSNSAGDTHILTFVHAGSQWYGFSGGTNFA